MKGWQVLVVAAAVFAVAGPAVAEEYIPVGDEQTVEYSYAPGIGVIFSDGVDDDCDCIYKVEFDATAQGSEKKKKALFEMVDGTLLVERTAGTGPARYCLKRKLTRAKARAAGIRTGTWCIMKRRTGTDTFLPVNETAIRRSGCSWSLRRNRAAPTRQEMRRTAARHGKLGLYGYELVGAEDIYVWAVTDSLSDFGAGGQIPEPTTLALLMAGGAAVCCLPRRRRR